MKKNIKGKLILGSITLFVATAVGTLLMSADHTDAPGITSTSSDIADLYAFQSTNPARVANGGNNNEWTTLIATLPAGNNAATAPEFDENVMIEFNIDNTGVDEGTTNITEDLVIQALRQGDSVYFFGPYAPTGNGTTSTITGEPSAVVAINGDPVTNDNGVFFAGLTEDPFFFGFTEFNTVIGTAPLDGFVGTTNDFEGLFVNTIAVEVRNSSLQAAPDHLVEQLLGADLGLPNSWNVWVETKRR